MIKEYVVKITNDVIPNVFSLFEKEYSPEQEIVRCKDCKHYMTIHCICDGCCISDDWFCAGGERKG